VAKEQKIAGMRGGRKRYVLAGPEQKGIEEYEGGGKTGDK